jgi:hypothetical protein
MEARAAASGRTLGELSATALDELWESAKRAGRGDRQDG